MEKESSGALPRLETHLQGRSSSPGQGRHWAAVGKWAFLGGEHQGV